MPAWFVPPIVIPILTLIGFVAYLSLRALL